MKPEYLMIAKGLVDKLQLVQIAIYTLQQGTIGQIGLFGASSAPFICGIVQDDLLITNQGPRSPLIYDGDGSIKAAVIASLQATQTLLQEALTKLRVDLPPPWQPGLTTQAAAPITAEAVEAQAQPAVQPAPPTADAPASS